MKIFSMVCKVSVIIALIVLAIVIIAYLFLVFYPNIGKIPSKENKEEYAKKTSQFYDGKFHNFEKHELRTGKMQKAEAKTEPLGEIPVVKIDSIENSPKDELTITWFGHSSVLVQMQAMNILIDPVLSEYASPVNFAGPKRFSDIPIEAEKLPQIDVLLLSHDHYDHMDYETIMKIDEKVKKYIVPLGVESYLKGWGIDENKIYAMAWWEEYIIDELNIIFTPTQHYSGRSPLGMNSTWWGGYLLQDEKHNVYFTGDGGYTKTFKEVYERFGSVDLILTDTGQYNEGWAKSHMNPKQAFQTAEDVHAKWIMPVHWGAFKLSNHTWYSPAELLTQYAEGSEVNVATPLIGQTVNFKDISSCQEQWWREVD